MKRRLGLLLLAIAMVALAVPATADICNGPCGRGGPGSGVSPGSANPPRISISDGTAQTKSLRGGTQGPFEGDPCEFIITRTKPRNHNSSVQWKTKNGSAVGGAAPGPGIDYQQSSGTAVFNSEQPKAIKIFVHTFSDSEFQEPNENFTVVLSKPKNGTIADVSGNCDIQNVNNN